MIFRANEAKTHYPLPGAQRCQAAVGESAQLVSFRFDRGAVVPNHCHPNEQVGMVISGRVLFIIGDEKATLGPGDGYFIPPGIEHSAEMLEDSVLVDVFTPPREDYRDR